MLTILVCASTLTAGCLSPATLTLQEAGVGVSGRLAAHKVHESMRADTPHGERTWRFMGPSNISGRVVDVAVPTPRGEHYTLYVATATGGLWRSRNEGTTFEPLFEDGPTGSIGALAVDPADSERLWMGTGEANIFRSSMAGTGIYLSEDGGTTFTHKGLEDTHTIARICVHPTDPNTVYVAASGHEWTDNPERGVYRTRDGGASWQRVLFVDEGTGAIDLALDPQDPSRIYAATWERKRLRWNDPRSYPATRGSGVWRSEDGGDSWQPINEGLPLPEHRGRIGLATTPSLPGSLYAFVDNYELVELEQDEERGEQDEQDEQGEQDGQDEQEDQMRAMGYGGMGRTSRTSRTSRTCRTRKASRRRPTRIPMAARNSGKSRAPPSTALWTTAAPGSGPARRTVSCAACPPPTAGSLVRCAPIPATRTGSTSWAWP